MQCLSDAPETNVASTLRHLFVTVLLFCEPVDTLNLFRTNLEDLSEDFRYRRWQQGLNAEELESVSENCILCDLDDRLKQHGSTTIKYHLPASGHHHCNQLDMAEEESLPGANVFFSEHINLLNAEQAAIFNTVRENIDNREGHITFLGAPLKNILQNGSTDRGETSPTRSPILEDTRVFMNN